MGGKRVLIFYYSFSSQTHLLVHRFASGLIDHDGIEVHIERLQTKKKLPFPFPSFFRLLTAMVTSFFRKREAVVEPEGIVKEEWDLIVLGGPTWSYSPSGPILYFLDVYGEKYFAGKNVLPIISCRSYWRTHYSYIKKRLTQAGAEVRNPIVLYHSTKEPWRTIGLYLQLLGRMPRTNGWFRKYYPRFGHSQVQYDAIRKEGEQVAEKLMNGSL